MKQYMLAFLLIATLLLSACGQGQVFGPKPTDTPTPTLTPLPTDTPTATYTPTPTPAATAAAGSGPSAKAAMDAALGIAQPKPGHWEGKNGVSFDLTADNKVSAFKITIPIGANECNLAMTKDFPIDAKGTFIIGELMPDGTLSSNSLYGIFTSATSVNGEFSKTIICGSTIQFFIVDTPWSAEWKTP